MRAEHDKFVRLVGSGNLADDIERIQIVIIKLVLDIHFDANGNFLFQRSPDAAVMLNGHDDLRRNRRIGEIPSASALNENSAAAALAGFDGRDYTLIEIKLQPPLVEIRSVAAAAPGAALSGTAAARRLYGLIRDVRKVLVCEPPAGSLKLRGNISHGRRHDVFASKLAAELLEILLVINDGSDDIRCDSTACSGRPRFRVSNQRETVGRRNRARRELLVRPTASKRAPRFQIDVREFPFRELLPGPVGRSLDLRRSRKAASVHVGQIAQAVHDLRVVEAFVLDLVDRIEVDFLLRSLRDDWNGD